MNYEDEKRLYFIIRSIIFALASGILLLSFVYILGQINFLQMLILSITVFLMSLFISRVFDSPITKVVRKILKFLEGHKKLRKIILRYF